MSALPCDALKEIYNDLQARINALVPAALADNSLTLPETMDGEGAFLRLLAWSYATVFETGRLTVGFLLDRTYGAVAFDALARCRSIREGIDSLRKLAFHSLDLGTHRAVAAAGNAAAWYVEACGEHEPRSAEHWSSCCQHLISEMMYLLQTALAALATIVADVDSAAIINVLRDRIRREWLPHEFDEIANKAATRLGAAVDGRKLRERRLSAWRNVIALLPDNADVRREITCVIESDILEFGGMGRSQLTGAEWMEELGIKEGPDVGRAVGIAKHLASEGVSDRAEVIRIVREEIRGRITRDIDTKTCHG